MKMIKYVTVYNVVISNSKLRGSSTEAYLRVEVDLTSYSHTPNELSLIPLAGFQCSIDAVSPQYKCGASLQTCSSVRSQRLGSFPPEDEGAPAWCCQAPQTPCRRHAQEGAPCHSPWPPARPDTEPWPSPCQGRLWLCGSASPASTAMQAHPDGGLLTLNVLA